MDISTAIATTLWAKEEEEEREKETENGGGDGSSSGNNEKITHNPIVPHYFCRFVNRPPSTILHSYMNSSKTIHLKNCFLSFSVAYRTYNTYMFIFSSSCVCMILAFLFRFVCETAVHFSLFLSFFLPFFLDVFIFICIEVHTSPKADTHHRYCILQSRHSDNRLYVCGYVIPT